MDSTESKKESESKEPDAGKESVKDNKRKRGAKDKGKERERADEKVDDQDTSERGRGKRLKVARGNGEVSPSKLMRGSLRSSKFLQDDDAKEEDALWMGMQEKLSLSSNCFQGDVRAMLEMVTAVKWKSHREEAKQVSPPILLSPRSFFLDLDAVKTSSHIHYRPL